MTKNKCCLCSQITGDKSNDLISTLLGEERYVRRIAVESDNFVVIPSLGPIAPGHTLLCPRSHTNSFSDMIAYFDGSRSGAALALMKEYFALKKKLTDLLEHLYGAPVHYFEHGSAKEGIRSICTVEHAHLHAIPADVDLLAVLKRDSVWEPARFDLLNLPQIVGRSEYLYYEAPCGEALIALCGDGFESQFLRRVFAEAIGSPNQWNWRVSPQPEMADKTYKSLAEAHRRGI